MSYSLSHKIQSINPKTLYPEAEASPKAIKLKPSTLNPKADPDPETQCSPKKGPYF